jgi:hypothetical protein
MGDDDDHDVVVNNDEFSVLLSPLQSQEHSSTISGPISTIQKAHQAPDHSNRQAPKPNP